MYKKIMVPLDGSELAECVLPHVEGFIKGFPESKFVFVRMVEPTPIPTIPGNGRTIKPISLEDRDAERKSNAQDYLNNVIDRIKTKPSNLDAEVIVGRVADGLADYVRKNDIDLILIATHGRSGISRWVRGSVADKVLRSANVPVLMVRAPGTKGGI
jgi:nucleotide-binding universal stress UspA family protein